MVYVLYLFAKDMELRIGGDAWNSLPGDLLESGLHEQQQLGSFHPSPWNLTATSSEISTSQAYPPMKQYYVLKKRKL